MLDKLASASEQHRTVECPSTQTWFHSTAENHIDTFWPLSHFGTEDVAIARAANRFFSGDSDHPGTLIKVSVDLDARRVFHIEEDWGSPKPVAFANAMRKHGPAEARDRFASLWSSFFRESPQCRLTRFEHRKLLAEAAMEFAIDALTYPNQVECRNDSVSICVTNPGIIRNAWCRSLSEQEVALAIDPENLMFPVGDKDIGTVRAAILAARQQEGSPARHAWRLMAAKN